MSRYWQERLAREYQVDSTVIYNGVNLARFHPATPAERAQARSQRPVNRDSFIQEWPETGLVVFRSQFGFRVVVSDRFFGEPAANDSCFRARPRPDRRAD